MSVSTKHTSATSELLTYAPRQGRLGKTIPARICLYPGSAWEFHYSMRISDYKGCGLLFSGVLPCCHPASGEISAPPLRQHNEVLSVSRSHSQDDHNGSGTVPLRLT